MTKEEFKNLAVGETFNIGVYKLKVKEIESYQQMCVNCFMLKAFIPACDEFCNEGYIPDCVCSSRKDKKNVIFEEVEDE